ASDLAFAAVFLASDEASFITGADIPVDGGLRWKYPTWRPGDHTGADIADYARNISLTQYGEDKGKLIEGRLRGQCNEPERAHPSAGGQARAVAAVRARHRDGHAAAHVLAAGGALGRARSRSRAHRAHPGRGPHVVPRREWPALPGGRALRAPAERAVHRLDR